MTASRRELLRLAGAAALLGTGSACARIPTESPIDSRPLSGRSRPGAPYVRALPPPEDATPQQVLTGFVQAGVGTEDDYAVAREYLTPDASAAWDPGAGVTVYSSSDELRVEQLGEDTVSLALQAVMLVDAQGVRSVLAGPTAQEITVHVQSVDGQWRIADPPPGIHLSGSAFEALFTPARLYFLDPRSLHLVPDLRWYSSHRAVPAVLEGLRAGPVESLESAVRNLVPSGADMEAVTVTTGADGVAEVTIPEAVRRLASAPRGHALAQLEASLRSLRALAEVRLLWDGTDLTAQVDRSLSRPLPGHRPIGAGPTGVVSLADAGGSDQMSQLVPDLAETVLSAPAISQDGVLACALSQDRSSVLMASTDGSVPVRQAAAGAAYADPRPDDAGYVWASVQSGTGVLLAMSAQGAEHDVKVDAAWLRGREVLGLDIAADATRLAVLSADEAGTRLDLCAVQRDEAGVPVSVSEPVVVRTGLVDMVQVGWYDEIALTVLGTDPISEELRAQVTDLATGHELLPPPRQGTVRLAGSVIAESVWAATEDGALMRSTGDRWASVDLPARDPAFY
ncbi:GerMN domain-containing protein [Brachybacterium sp. p3-SID957]|uniref:GerMN domain-containing protein n=1 Tax=Brachybacterium sp. p3-SID957 TaxID=2916049 RepID=UPI00223B2B35|nr:GerMN domain-containing protein [Brachybacterium sp. p3-SID957]MCT1775087.1 LpqB family beta-propeller domain-containing protein [Brachybacterium sp. p3-SID957]